jgi:hypothetical protein
MKRSGVAGLAQVHRHRGEGPAPRRQAHLLADLLEAPAAEVPIQVLPPAVLRVLEALRHDLRVREPPEVHVLRVVAAEEEVEPAVAVVVEPERRVDVRPGRQPRALGAHERLPAVVAEELLPAPAIEQQVLEPVVVVVAPDRAHRDARSRAR